MYRIDGETLAKFTSSEKYLASLAYRVAPTPGQALRRIVDSFGVVPKPSGCNIEGIQIIRNALYESSAGRHELLHAFLIVAPHTHWDSRNPVILSKAGQNYRIGPQEIVSEEIYTPISFALTNDGLHPYEWADASIQLSDNELLPAMRMLDLVQKVVADNKWPLGLSLNCRYKGLLDPPAESTLEYSEDGLHADASTIYLLSDFYRRIGVNDYVQVGWHPYSDRSYDLSPESTLRLHELRTMAEELSDIERAELRKILLTA